MGENPHKRAEDESINIALIHKHINDNTPSGIKIRDSFKTLFGNEVTLISTIESGGNRGTHYDLQIKCLQNQTEIIQNVEFKGSKHYKPIDSTKPPWKDGVQFYNGTGSKFEFVHKYALTFYNRALDEIISHYNIQTPKPTYEEWIKDAFKQGKPSSDFVKEIRDKGYRSKYLSDCRKKFNLQFHLDALDLITLMDEIYKIANDALSCKDYWLQIHGNINNPDEFYVSWTKQIIMPEIQEIYQLPSKIGCDINIQIICVDNSKFTAKLRWGYGQCIANLRVDIK